MSITPARLRAEDGIVGLLRPPNASLRAATRLWRRNMTLYRRSWHRNILPNFFEPLLYLVSIGLGLGLFIGEQILGVDYVVYIAPGLAAAAAMNGAVFEVTYNVYVKLRYYHLYDAVVTTPLEPEDVALGELLWATTRSFIYGTAFLLVIAALGYVRSPAALLAPLAVVLIGGAFALIGMIVTTLMPGIDFFSYFFTLFITPLFLFSGIFFPVEVLPAAAQPIAWLTPLHHGVEIVRALLLTGEVRAVAGHALWLAVFSALLYAPAVNLFRRRLVV
ncbi:MAG TPA: ABC transporter permease [Egibacteraceae bacterium]|jgi:lipooligosaccharide transport system permease protein|nr:ABC transporter permease [Egibacteraceae bacterium]